VTRKEAVIPAILSVIPAILSVIPAKAGIQSLLATQEVSKAKSLKV